MYTRIPLLLNDIHIFTYIVNALALIAIPTTPCLTILAFRSWRSDQSNDLPPWRNVLGFVSISATFLCWLGYVAFLLTAGLKSTWLDSKKWLYFELVTLILGLPSVVVLRTYSRVQALFATFLMVVLLLATVNF